MGNFFFYNWIYTTKMTESQTMFVKIMLFYAFLTYIMIPGIFYFFVEKSLKSAGKGFIVGSVLSIVLWLLYGSKMI